MDIMQLKNIIPCILLRNHWLDLADWMWQETELVDSMMSMNLLILCLNENFTKLKVMNNLLNVTKLKKSSKHFA